MRRSVKRKKYPRVPPIRKTGGAHKIKKGSEPKHKKNDYEEWNNDRS